MPKITTKRDDILRKAEMLEMLRSDSEPWLKALIALLWMYGKRISETLAVKKSDVWKDKKYLYVRFNVLKKKKRKNAPTPKPYVKKKTLRHSGAKYILEYLADLEEETLFNVSRQLALYYLKKINPKSWFHLFRESLATEMAEHGASEEQLLHWFDWERADSAHTYVKRGTKLIEMEADRAD
jgi:integrase